MEAFAAPGSREALLNQLDDIGEVAPLICSRGSYDETELRAFSEATGLAPVFVLLVRSLTRSKPDFAREVVKAVPNGANTTAVPLAWLKSVWSHIASAVDDPALEKAASLTFDLHTRATAGEIIPASEWRSARASFRKIEQEDAVAASAIIAAAAWDPASAPGAMGDVAMAREVYATQRTSKALGWTAEHERKRSAYFDAMIKYGEEYAGPRASNERAWRDTEAGREWGKRMQEGVRKFQDINKPDFPDINAQLMQVRDEVVAEAQHALLSALVR